MRTMPSDACRRSGTQSSPRSMKRNRHSLSQRSAELMEQMNAEQEESVNVDRFMELVDRYTDFTELTTPHAQ